MRRAGVALLGLGQAAGLCIAGAFWAGAATAGENLTVSTGPNSNVSCVRGVCSPTAANANLNVGKLQSLLASHNTKVATAGISAGGDAGDIVVAAALTWASSKALTLDSFHSVKVTKAVSVAGPAPLTIATNDGGSGGSLSFAAGAGISFLGTGNPVRINGNAYKLVASVAALASAAHARPAGFIALAANYDAASDGVYNAAPVAKTFTGIFEGFGNTISHFAVDDLFSKHSVGLFAQSSGTIENVNLASVDVRGSANSLVGALVGSNQGTLLNDSSSGSVATDSGTLGPMAGGITGYNNGGTVAGSHSSATVSGSDDAYIGGLIGETTGNVRSSFATGAVTDYGEHASAGGLIGYATGNSSLAVSDSYATGAVNGYDADLTGGLIGTGAMPIQNCYAMGTVRSDASAVGGLVGVQYSGNITASYAAGALSGAGSGTQIGGVIGNNNVSSATNSSTYWDTTTTGVSVGVGAGSAAGLAGLTTTQMKSGLPGGFSSVVWGERAAINGGFPYLLALPPS